MPFVSVVIPAFNGEKYILDCVKSIIFQTFKDIEIIIVDDGSTDRTGEIIRSINDDRIIYWKLEKNMGTAAATNAGHDLARGKYIAHLDQDDLALPDRLEQQISFLERFTQVDVLGGWVESFGNVSGFVGRAPTSDGDIKANFLAGASNIYNPTAMFRRSFMKARELKCDPDLGGAFDWGFWVQAMFNGACFANLDKIIVRYRFHKNQQSKDLSRFRHELSRIRLSVMELFYPNLTADERNMVEPLLEITTPPPLKITEIEAGLNIMVNKLLQYNTQSAARESREKLQEFLVYRKAAINKTLETYHQKSS